MFGFVKKTTPT